MIIHEVRVFSLFCVRCLSCNNCHAYPNTLKRYSRDTYKGQGRGNHDTLQRYDTDTYIYSDQDKLTDLLCNFPRKIGQNLSQSLYVQYVDDKIFFFQKPE